MHEYPKVGVVVAKDGLILSTGFRGEVAKKHAEPVALEKLAMLERIGVDDLHHLGAVRCPSGKASD